MGDVLTWVIGDVHGCALELNELLIKLIQRNQPIRVLFVGDLVDKGPDSLSVIETIAALEAYDLVVEVIVAMGNHENKLLRWCDHEYRKSKFPSYINPIDKKPEWNIPLVKWAMGSTDLNPPHTGSPITKFPLWINVPNNDWIVVHAGLPASLKELPPKNYTKATRRDKQVMYCRYLNNQGNMIQLGFEKPSDPYWDDVYDGRFGKVIYGHQSYQEPKVTDFAVGIDTGCVYGNKLTAYCPDLNEFISVQAKKAYCEPYASEGIK